MNPRDRDPAAPRPEPDDSPADWATEESVTEPDADAPAAVPTADVASAAARPAARPPAAADDTDTWLASAVGLLPWDPAAGHSADDSGWQAISDPSEVSPGPSVGARAGAAHRWVPPANPDDPDSYGSTPLYDSAVAAGRASSPAWDPRLDAAFAPGQYERSHRRGIPWRRLVLSFVLGFLLTCVVAGGAIYAYEQQYTDRILPNVHVGAVDVSGLTRDVARDRLARAYDGYREGIVRVTLAGATTEIPYAAFDRRADLDAMLDAAFAVGRAPSAVDRLIGELRTVTKGVTLMPTVVLDAGKLRERVHDIARAAEWDAVDASAVVTATGFSTTPSKSGQVVTEGTAAEEAAQQLMSVDAPRSVDIALTATPILPAVTDASAQAGVRQAALMDNDVVLADGPDSWVVPAATVHTWLSFTIINNRVRIAIDTKAVLAELKPLAKRIDRTAVDATVKLQGTKVVFDKPSVDGRTFNASKTTTAVVNGLRNRALGNLDPAAPIAPVLALEKPALTTAEAKAAIPLMTQISSWITNYQPSERNGNGANIRIPTATINGYVVAPGATFSFWKAVGPVTTELGYTAGGAIIDGHTEPQGAIGGGICSASTTLFNAALRAGFAMGDRLNHFYYINRYPLGLDATVFISASGQAQDMTWTNDSDYPVIIQGINGKTSVKYVLYGVPNGRTTTFSDPIVKNYTKAHTENRVDKTIPPGTRRQIEYATDGQDVWVTRTVKDQAGAVIHKETFYSHYATITGIILTNP